MQDVLAKLRSVGSLSLDGVRPVAAPAMELLQGIAPRAAQSHYEGCALSADGRMLAVADAHDNAVLLFRKHAGAGFETVPYRVIEGEPAGLDFPHDVSFGPSGSGEILAVAQRDGVVSLFDPQPGAGDAPLAELRGAETDLSFSDGVAFVPPDGRLLAVSNLLSHSITFYARPSLDSVCFEPRPVHRLAAGSIMRPDGLGISPCGGFLAVANHGAHSVSLFRRGADGGYGPRAMQIISGPDLVHPHSVAFTEGARHLVITNSGAAHVTVLARQQDVFGVSWQRMKHGLPRFTPKAVFDRVNGEDPLRAGRRVWRYGAICWC